MIKNLDIWDTYNFCILIVLIENKLQFPLKITRTELDPKKVWTGRYELWHMHNCICISRTVCWMNVLISGNGSFLLWTYAKKKLGQIIWFPLLINVNRRPELNIITIEIFHTLLLFHWFDSATFRPLICFLCQHEKAVRMEQPNLRDSNFLLKQIKSTEAYCQ